MTQNMSMNLLTVLLQVQTDTDHTKPSISELGQNFYLHINMNLNISKLCTNNEFVAAVSLFHSAPT